MQPRRKKRWEVIDIDNEDDNTNESRKKKRKVSLSPQGNTNSNNVASAVICLYISSACDFVTIECGASKGRMESIRRESPSSAKVDMAVIL